MQICPGTGGFRTGSSFMRCQRTLATSGQNKASKKGSCEAFLLAYAVFSATWPQDGPKMAPRWPKMAPRWPQDGPKMAPRWPKMAQDGPRWPQDSPKMAQESPEMVQDVPKMARDGSKMAP